MDEKIDKLVELAVLKMNIPESLAREMVNNIIPRAKRWA
jgi:hypothetical protein